MVFGFVTCVCNHAERGLFTCVTTDSLRVRTTGHYRLCNDKINTREQRRTPYITHAPNNSMIISAHDNQCT